VGKSRATIANSLRLLTLPPEILAALREGKITASHGKILLSAVTPHERTKLFNQILDGRLPVRAAGDLGRTTTVRRHVRRSVDPVVIAAEDDLRDRFGTKVSISKRADRGSVSIEFYSDEEYINLINRLRGV
jgi:ParB family chromosome partitioning protein